MTRDPADTSGGRPTATQRRSATESFEAYAVCAPGLESLVRQELDHLGVTDPRITEGGVTFAADAESLYRANLHLRTAGRVLIRLARFHAASFAELERRARRVVWDRFVEQGTPVTLRVTCRKSRLYHSDAVSERLSGALRSSVGATPARPSRDHRTGEDVKGDAQLFVVRIDRNECTISADSSGANLHQRGYRRAVTEAPLRETLAAAMVLASGWNRESPLLDPMCGSGTIPIEAALIARGIAPGRGRSFRFMEWPGFDEQVWRRVLDRARTAERDSAAAAIIGSDRSSAAIRAAADNARRAGVEGDIEFVRGTLSGAAPPPGMPGWIVTNPPYGVRLGSRAELQSLEAEFGRILKARFAGWHVGLLAPETRPGARWPIVTHEAFRTTNGGLPVRFLHGDVPSGTPRAAGLH